MYRLLLKSPLTFVALILLSNLTYAEEMVINALPLSAVYSSEASTNREMLNQSKQDENRLVITKDKGNYYWASRDNQELVHISGGAIHVFIEKKGDGYITVFDQSTLPEAIRSSSLKIQYKEHLRNFMGSITYWGEADSFLP